MFYVYELRDETGKPFYVGKGKGRRRHAHECKARRGDPSHVCCKIRSIWKRGGTVQAVPVFESEDEAAAFCEEKRLIAFYGRRRLTNKTDGGDGPANPPPAVRAKIAAARKGCVASEATRHRQRLAKLGKPRSAETRAKIAATIKGRAHPWARATALRNLDAIHATKLPRQWSEEQRAKFKATRTGHKVSKATRRKISNAKKKR